MSNINRRPARPARPSHNPPAAPHSGFRRRHPLLSALAPVALVVLALATLVVIKTTGGTANATPSASKIVAGSSSAGADTGASPLASGVLADVTSVSPKTFAAIGSPSGVTPPVATAKNTALLTANDGKPEILYVGAEYCPYCAAQRWAVVVALSHFGTFSGLHATHSSTTDVYPDTRTFSFYGSSYTSPTLDFVPVEEQSNQVVGNTYATLQVPTAAEDAVLAKYDTAPYTSEPGSIPFLSIANKYLSIGASYNPQVLQGLSMQAIAAQLNNPSSLVATDIDGAANQITAAITAITGVQPGSTGTATTGSQGQ